MSDDPLRKAVDAALAGDWEGAHRLVQERREPIACWIHAVLHKIEGDVWNSRYWYARTPQAEYEDYNDPLAELRAIRETL
ncbi:MAG: hypothetical protein N2Z69_06630 [Methylophilaceae bacterium]|nr:hypothetical protein [Methylophilaceae bacterium]